MTYCLGIMSKFGLVMASDSRTNAGYDQINVYKKMHTFIKEDERVFIILTSGSLSLSQSVLTLLRKDFERGAGLAKVETLYEGARVIGEQIRKISKLDREALERDEYNFNCHFLLGGQIRGEKHDLYLVYPQGNPIQATTDSPYLQIGESKYGRPILDRGVRFDKTTLEEAAKYALLSIDSTMRSNVTVGPPIDMAVYTADDFKISGYRRFTYKDKDFTEMHTLWEESLREAVKKLPPIKFD